MLVLALYVDSDPLVTHWQSDLRLDLKSSACSWIQLPRYSVESVNSVIAPSTSLFWLPPEVPGLRNSFRRACDRLSTLHLDPKPNAVLPTDVEPVLPLVSG